MKKIITICLLASFFLINKATFADDLEGIYPSVVEKLIYYKNDKFKVFYGGPVDRATGGLRWVSLISLEDQFYKTRAVYEVCFVNCDFQDAEDAEILFVKVSDVNIKLKNVLNPDYEIFSYLLDGKYNSGKYIVVRHADTAITFFPDVFIATTGGDKLETNDKQMISQFLHNHFKSKTDYLDYYNGGIEFKIDSENEDEISYKPFRVGVEFDGDICHFNLVKKVLKNDFWKLYYVVSNGNCVTPFTNANSSTLIRIDSGCISGQIYDDDACDCVDQLHEGLYQLSQEPKSDSLIIHIPAHDGRGFGTAPKAETEIYKRGGKGRVHTTKALDTIEAAKLLYGSLNFDLRTYDGAAKIIKSMGINKISLLTDNVLKVNTMEKYGIEVIRKKTGSEKMSCIEHIKSKKQSPNYYKN